MNQKYLNVFWVFTLLLCSGSGFGQRKISEAKIVFEISYPEMMLDSQMLANMPNESVVFVKGNLSRTDLDLGMGISSSTIFNSSTGEVIALTDLMGTKTAMKMSREDQGRSKRQNKRSEMKVEVTDYTKEIAGYTCKRAVVNDFDETSLEIYFTEQISARSSATIDWEEINGFPMQYYLIENGLRMKFEAKEVILEQIDSSIFEIPAGYKLITKEEMMKMMGEEK